MNKESEPDNMHQVHINIPIELHNDLKEILPEKGMLSGLIRRFLRNYVYGIKGIDGLTRSPADVAVESIIKEDLERR